MNLVYHSNFHNTENLSIVLYSLLQTWKQRIEDEIAEIRRVYDTALHQKAITMQSPTRRTAQITTEDDDDHIYSEPPPDDDDSDDEQNGYARPKSMYNIYLWV